MNNNNTRPVNKIDFNNDELLVTLNLRPPMINIDRRVFAKTVAEKEVLKDTKARQGKIATVSGLIVPKEVAVAFKNKARSRSYGNH